MTQALARYTAVMIAIIAVAAWLLTLALTGSGASFAIGVSAAVAAVVQIAAFSLTQSMGSHNPIAAWGAGALVRMFALFAYAIVAVKLAGLPAAPALVSLAVFFFVSMLLEPVFLRP
jgi:hypothetical protein